MKVARERPSAPVLIVEGEHAHAARLAVAVDREHGGLCAGRLAQRPENPVELGSRPMAEEREGDVQLLGREHPYVSGVCERTALPRDEPEQGCRRQPERAEEAYPFIALEASSRIHTTSCRLCAKSLRTRWRAAAVARARIASRSPGKLSSRPTPLPG